MNKNKGNLSKATNIKVKTADKKSGGAALIVFLIIFGLNTLTAAVLSPIFVKVSSDITYSSSYLPDVLYYAVGFINIVALFCGYGAVVYSVSKHTLKSGMMFIFVALGGVLFNYAVSFTFDLFQYKEGMPASVVSQTLSYFGTNFAVECIKITFIVLITLWIKKKLPSPTGKHNIKIFDKRSALNMSMLFAACLFTLIMILSELPNTIEYFVLYGSDVYFNEIVSIIYAYVSAILSGAIGYFIMLFIAVTIDSKNTVKTK